MRRESFVTGEFFHVYCRGVDKRTIFTSEREYLRFVNTLFIFNNFISIPNRFDILDLEPKELLTPTEQLVEITAGCLMPNHYHLMVSSKSDGGVSRFLQKVNSSHTHYFNKVHERTGRLFESTFKARHVDRHEYAQYLTQYIHLNPVDLYRSKIGTEVLADVEKYKWSTLPIYLGKISPFSRVVSTDFRDKVLDMDAKTYRDVFKDVFSEVYRS